MLGVSFLNVARLASKHVGAIYKIVHLNYRMTHILCYMILLDIFVS